MELFGHPLDTILPLGLLAVHLARCQAQSTPIVLASASIVVTAYNLTTLFTPPGSCLALAYWASDTTTGLTGLPVTEFAERSVGCYPPGFQATVQVLSTPPGAQPTVVSPLPYWLPGICPSGYTQLGHSRDYALSYTNCCPSILPSVFGTAYLDGYNDCIFSLSTTTVGTRTVFKLNSTISWGVDDPALMSTLEPSASYSGDIRLVDPAVVVANYLSSATTTPPGSGGNPAAATSSPTGTTISSTGTADSSDSSLSTGAGAGIGVGVALGVIFTILLVILAWRRRQNRPRTSQALDYEKAELPDTSKPTPQLVGEELHEIGSEERKPEVGGSARAELNGTWRGYELDGTGVEQKGKEPSASIVT